MVLGPLAGLTLELLGPTITNKVNELLDTDDDHLATVQIELTPKNLLTLTRAKLRDFEGVQAHFETPLIAADDSTYKLYFAVE